MNSTSNYSFYAIPVAWILAILPHTYATTLSRDFDNRSPRSYIKTLQADQSIDQATKDKITRLEGAQSNGFENIAFFASAIVAGNLAGVPPATLNSLAGGYLVSRVVYTLLYVNNNSQVIAAARSVAFTGGIAQIFTLFIKAGNLLRDRPANLL